MRIYVIPEDDSMKAKVKAWAYNRKVDLKYMWEEHPVETIAAGTVGAGLIRSMIKAIGKQAALRKEERLKDLRVWDPVNGFYWYLRKKMSQDQQLEFESRKKAGETSGSILRSMRVL